MKKDVLMPNGSIGQSKIIIRYDPDALAKANENSGIVWTALTKLHSINLPWKSDKSLQTYDDLNLESEVKPGQGKPSSSFPEDISNLEVEEKIKVALDACRFNGLGVKFKDHVDPLAKDQIQASDGNLWRLYKIIFK